MTRTHLFIQEPALQKLKVISEATGTPVSELIRRAIEDWLGKQK